MTQHEFEFAKAGVASQDDLKAVEKKLGSTHRTVTATSLATDVTVGQDAESFDQQVTAERLQQRKLETARLKQANDLRKWFHWLAWVVVGVCVITSGVFVGCQMYKNQASNTLLIAFVSGVTIQVIGILAIVARYLFAPAPPPRDND